MVLAVALAYVRNALQARRKASPALQTRERVGELLDLVVRPNPTADLVSCMLTPSVSPGASVNYVLTDANGRSVMHGNGMPDIFELDLSGLAPGMYLLMVQASERTFERIIMRQ